MAGPERRPRVRVGPPLSMWSRRLAVPRAVPVERLAAAALIVAATVWHIAFLVTSCPLELAADEAHYWDWSRHLDWSYYSKGPLVAWVIRASRFFLADLSTRLVGSEMLAVRLPAVAFSAGLLVSVY